MRKWPFYIDIGKMHAYTWVVYSNGDALITCNESWRIFDYDVTED